MHKDDVILNFNTFLQKLCSEHHVDGLYQCQENALTAVWKHKVIENCINQLSERFPYIQYSYFRNEFCFYELRKYGKQYTKARHNEFKDIDEGRKSFWDIVHPWFPDANIEHVASPTEKSQALLTEFLAAHPDMLCTDDEQDALCSQLRQIWGEEKGLNTLLKKFCIIKITRKGHDPRTPNYHVYNIQESE